MGQLSGAEKENFEHQLAHDPELESSFQFQKEIVETLRESRRMELKNMLNQISVGSSGSTSSGLFGKIAAGVAIVSLIGMGSYYLLNINSEQTTAQSTSEQTTEELLLNREPAQNEGIAALDEDQTIDEQTQPHAEAGIEEPPVEETLETVAGNAETAVPVVEEPNFEKPEALDEFGVEEASADEISVPETYSTAKKESLTKSNIEVLTDNTKKKYSFHYQFSGERLYLYGSFDKDLYEILEFNSDNKRTVFLYYRNKYYPIFSDTKKITPLEELDEKQLVEKLDNIRNNN